VSFVENSRLEGLYLDVVAQLCDFNPSLQSLWILIVGFFFLTHAGVFPNLFYAMSPFHLLLPRFRSLLPDRVNPPAFSLSVIDIYQLTANCPLLLYLRPVFASQSVSLVPVSIPFACSLSSSYIPPRHISKHVDSLLPTYPIYPPPPLLYAMLRITSNRIPVFTPNHTITPALSLSIATTTTPFLYKFAFHFFSVPSYLVPSPNSLYTLYFLHIQGGKKKKENYIFED
jgi:hypothetical protein